MADPAGRGRHDRPLPRRSITPKIWKIALALIASIVIGFSTYALVEHHNPLGVIAQAAIPNPQAVFGKSSILVLVEGLDYDYNARDEETSAHSRSDIIMAIRLDFAKHHIYELSVPRDMVATLPSGVQAKINAAQSEGGVTEAQLVISKWLGIPRFDRYVVLRIDMMKNLINALGGVDVYVKSSDCLMYKTHCTGQTIDYDDTWGHLHVHMTEGLQHLTGPQAVGYSRFREDWCSDPCRIMRQQQVIRAILVRLHKNGLDSLISISPLIAIINKDVTTNLSSREELSVAFAYRNLTQGTISMAEIPYVAVVDLPDYGDSILPDEGAKRRLVLQYLMPQQDALR